MELVVFLLDGLRYGVPLELTRRATPMLAVSHLPDAPDIAIGVINLHGQVIPVLDIRRRFGLPPRAYGPEAHLLVVQTPQRTVAFPVDEVVGVEQYSFDQLTPSNHILPGLSQVAGVLTLEDDLLFVHDVDAFLSLDEDQHLQVALGGYDRGTID